MLAPQPNERPSPEERQHRESLYAETRTALSYARTMMSGERTLLSFFTAGLSLLAGGVGLVKYVGHPALQGLGWLLIPFGVFVWIRGVVRYLKIRTLLKQCSSFLEREGLTLPTLFLSGEAEAPAPGGEDTGS